VGLTGIPENAEARALLKETIFAPIRTAADAARRVVNQRETDTRVLFQANVEADNLYLIFANEIRASFPLAGAGNWVIKRSLADGSFLQAKIFLGGEEERCVRIRPQGERSVLDLYMLGGAYQTGVNLPLSFEKVLTTSFADLRRYTERVVDWDALLSTDRTGADARVERVAGTVRSLLSGLRDVDDGAPDEAGRPVFIATGQPQGRGGGFNCSGFAKWIVDGFYKPLVGRGTGIEAMKERREDRGNRWTRPLERTRDPFFGLDWSRNLALALQAARIGAPDAPSADPADVDVRDVAGFEYEPNVGYAVADLPRILFRLVQDDPGSFYLGSINQTGGSPPLRTHFHLVALFPYRDADGRFRTAVMERNTETGLESLVSRFGNCYVHLVHLDTEGEFSPSLLPSR